MSKSEQQQHDEKKIKVEDNANADADAAAVDGLMERIETLFPDSSITVQVATQLLEASNGNVDMAVSLFYENIVVVMGGDANKKQKKKKSIKKEPHMDDDEDDAGKKRAAARSPSFDERHEAKRPAAAEDSSDGGGEDDDRRIRRRLEGRFDRMQDNNRGGGRSRRSAAAARRAHDDDDDDDERIPNRRRAAGAWRAGVGAEPDEPMPAAAVPAAAAANRRRVRAAAAAWRAVRAADAARDDDNEEEEEEPVPAMDNNNDVAGANAVVEADGAAHRNNNNNNNRAAAAAAIEGSVSVSDDEGVWRMEGQIQPRAVGIRRNVSDRNDDNNNHNNDDMDAAAAPDDDVIDDNDETYLSDDDWITGTGKSFSDPQQPLEVLWGRREDTSTAEDDDNDDNNNEEEEDAPPPPTPPSRIPLTWLHAGFSMEPTSALGLVLKPPSDEDAAFYRQQQQQDSINDTSRAMILPPHHCKAVTAVLGIVQATILTGASIQGNRVDCSSAQTPFGELSNNQTERAKQFEGRLAKAIAALLWVALDASVARKKRAIAARAAKKKKTTTDDSTISEQQFIKRRLRLCPTCCWKDGDEPPDNLTTRAAYNSIMIESSFSHVDDLQSYVKSNMRSFTGRGGCALLLECIVRIHGAGTIKRMLNNNNNNKSCSLIHCTCKERQPKVSKKKTLPTKPILDTTPPGHECLSIELLSLLMCGQVHSTFDGGWGSPLGFGILSNNSGDATIGTPLLCPTAPVWMLRGDTCHSIIAHHVDTSSSSRNKSSNTDQDSASVLQLSHWNMWYNQRHASSMRLICARNPHWTPPPRLLLDSKMTTTTKSSFMDRIQQQRRNSTTVVVSDGDEQQETTPAAVVVEDDEEMQDTTPTMVIHESDKHYYPKEYRRWRFAFFPHTNDNDTTTTTAVPHNWIPFHALTEDQRRIVEMKLAPRITTILWSRWPGATVDQFKSSDDGDDASFPIV